MRWFQLDGIPERGGGCQPGGVRGQQAHPGHVPAETHGPAVPDG